VNKKLIDARLYLRIVSVFCFKSIFIASPLIEIILFALTEKQLRQSCFSILKT